MALKVTLTVNGAVLPDAYVRVVPITASKTLMSFRTETFALDPTPVAIDDDSDEVKAAKSAANDAKAALIPFVAEHVCPFDMGASMAGQNDWRQAYAHLRTLPEFAGATDV